MTEPRASARSGVVHAGVPSPLALTAMAFVGFCSVAIVVAALIADLPPFQRFAAHHLSLGLQPAPRPRVGDVVSFFIANFRHGGWVLLVALILPPRMGARFASLLDTLVGVSMLLNVIVVAAAIAVAGTALIPYVPHLPLEWTGLAVAAGGWLRARCGASRREIVAHLAVFAVFILAAAVVEVYLVPHQ